jgi:hypothetical protein
VARCTSAADTRTSLCVAPVHCIPAPRYYDKLVHNLDDRAKQQHWHRPWLGEQGGRGVFEHTVCSSRAHPAALLATVCSARTRPKHSQNARQGLPAGNDTPGPDVSLPRAWRAFVTGDSLRDEQTADSSLMYTTTGEVSMIVWQLTELFGLWAPTSTQCVGTETVLLYRCLPCLQLR